MREESRYSTATVRVVVFFQTKKPNYYVKIIVYQNFCTTKLMLENIIFKTTDGSLFVSCRFHAIHHQSLEKYVDISTIENLVDRVVVVDDVCYLWNYVFPFFGKPFLGHYPNQDLHYPNILFPWVGAHPINPLILWPYF